MKTLNPSITSTFYADPETGFANLKRVWMEAGLHKDSDPAVHILYMVLRGRDYRKGLTAPTNPNKIANGGLENWAAKRAIRSLRRSAVVTQIAARLGGTFLAGDLPARVACLLPPPRHGQKALDEFCAPAGVEAMEVAG